MVLETNGLRNGRREDEDEDEDARAGLGGRGLCEARAKKGLYCCEAALDGSAQGRDPALVRVPQLGPCLEQRLDELNVPVARRRLEAAHASLGDEVWVGLGLEESIGHEQIAAPAREE